MDGLTLFGLAVALGMDAFAVSVASGMTIRRPGLRHTFRLGWHFGLFQALMPIMGWLGARPFAGFVAGMAGWVAFSILGLIGAKMIYDGFCDEEEKEACDPSKGLSLIMLSVGTSIDALAVGISFSFLQIDIWIPALVIGIVALSMSIIGLHAGAFIARKIDARKWANVLGGITLIGIGLRILIQHAIE